MQSFAHAVRGKRFALPRISPQSRSPLGGMLCAPFRPEIGSMFGMYQVGGSPGPEIQLCVNIAETKIAEIVAGTSTSRKTPGCMLQSLAGVNLHCALCDEILFTTPLELAAALLDFLLETMADSHWIAGQAEQAGQGQAGYAIAARIQSAVCVGAAMIRPLDPMPEILYNKLQQVLLDFQVQAMHPTRSSPLKELERATLLHSKFLLELCFGSGRLSSMPTRLAVRLFSAMQVSDGLTIWSIVEESP